MVSYQEYKFNTISLGFTATGSNSGETTFSVSNLFTSLATYSFQTSFYRQESFSASETGFIKTASNYYANENGYRSTSRADSGETREGAGLTGFRKKCDSFVPTTFTKKRGPLQVTYTEAGFVNQTYYAMKYNSASYLYKGGFSGTSSITFNRWGGETQEGANGRTFSDERAGAAFGGCAGGVDTGSFAESSSFSDRNTYQGAVFEVTGDPAQTFTSNVDATIKVYPNPCEPGNGWNNTNNTNLKNAVRNAFLVNFNIQPVKVDLTRTTDLTSTGQTATRKTDGTISYYDTENFSLFLQETTDGTVISTLETKVESYSTKTIETNWTQTASTDWTSTGKSETTRYTTVPKFSNTYSVNELGEEVEYVTTYKANETTKATTTVLSTATKETTVAGGTTETTTADRTLIDGTATETTGADISTWVQGTSSRFIITETDVTFKPAFSDTAGFVPSCITFSTSDYSKKDFDIEDYNTNLTPYFKMDTTSTNSDATIQGFGVLIATANVYKIQDFEVMYTVGITPEVNKQSYYALTSFFKSVNQKETTYLNPFSEGEKFLNFVDKDNVTYTNSWSGKTVEWTYTTSDFTTHSSISTRSAYYDSYEYLFADLPENTRVFTSSRKDIVLANKIDYLPVYHQDFGKFVVGWKSYNNQTTISKLSTFTQITRKKNAYHVIGGGGRTEKISTRSLNNAYEFDLEIGENNLNSPDLTDVIGLSAVSDVQEITALYLGDLKGAGWYGFGAINKNEDLGELKPYLGVSSRFSGKGNNNPSEEDRLNLNYTNISNVPVGFSESGSLFFNGGCSANLGEQNGTLAWYRQKEDEQLSEFGTSTKLLATYRDTYNTINAKGDATISATYTFGTYSLYMDSSYSGEFDELLMSVGTAGLYKQRVTGSNVGNNGYFNTDTYGADCLGARPNYLSYSYGKSSLDTGMQGVYLYDIKAPKNDKELTLVIPRGELVVSKYTRDNKFLKDTIINEDACATFTIQDGFRRRIELRPLVRVYKSEGYDVFFQINETKKEEFDSFGSHVIIPYQLPLSLDGWNGPLVTACST